MPKRLLRYCITACGLLSLPFHASAQNPKAAFTANRVAGCGPLVVTFLNTSTGTNTPLLFTWDFGNGNTSTKKSPSNIYTSSGKYTVSLTVKDLKGNTNTLTRTNYITVYEAPAANFGTSVRGGCMPFNVQFRDSSIGNSGPLANWVWDFGDGNISSAQNPSHVYTQTGIYDVSLLVKDKNGCQGSLVKSSYIYVSKEPQVDFSSPASSACAAPMDVTFIPSVVTAVTGPVKYFWTFGDGSTSTQQSPTHSYVSNGSYDVSLMASDSVGCSFTTIKKSFVQIFKEKADFTTAATQGCVPFHVSFTNKSDLLPGSQYTWDFGDGTTSNATSPTHDYLTAKKYTVKLKAITTNGCVDSMVKTNYIEGLIVPKAAFSASDSMSCKPFSITFTDKSQNASAWAWDFGDGGTSALQNVTHSYAGYGTFSVSLKVTATGGCTNTLTKTSLVKIAKPGAAFSVNASSGCKPLKVSFTNNTTSVTPIQTWAWDFGDAGTSALKNPPPHTYLSAGTYTVKLTATTIDGCSDVATVTIKAGDRPKADFTASPTKACLSAMTVSFTNLTNTYPVQADAFLWDFGDGSTSSSVSPSHTYTDKPGKYTVRLIAFQNGCSDTLIKKDYIEILPPRSKFTYSKGACDPQNVKFTDQSEGPDQWLWDFGDGNTSTTQNPSHTFGLGATYTVKLTVTNVAASCSHTSQQTVSIPQKLNASFTTNDTATCYPGFVQFTSSVTEPVSYSWDFGNGTTSTAQNPSLTYTSPGTYTIKLHVVNGNGCAFDTVRTAYVKVYGAVPDFTALPFAGCVPVKIDFADKTTSGQPIVNRIWNFGDGSALIYTTSTAVSHTYTSAPTNQKTGYPVQLSIVDAHGCTTKVSHTVIPALPKPSFTYTTVPGCGRITYNFSAIQQDSVAVGKPGYLWRFGDATTASTSSVTRVYTTATSETVELTLTDSFSCKRTITQFINITVPVLDAKFGMVYTQTDCPPLQVSFHDSTKTGFAPVKEWSWDFGDGTTSSVRNPEKLYSEAGDYTIKLTATDTLGCSSSYSLPLKVKGPVGSYSFDQKGGCFPLMVNFKAVTKGATSLTWDFGDGELDTGTTITHTYFNAGDFVPVLVLSDSSCTYALDPVDTIRVTSKPVARFNVSGQCAGDVTQFTPLDDTNGGKIVKYNWVFGDGQTSTDTMPSHAYVKKGTYNVTLRIENQWGCSDTVLRKVTIGSVSTRFGAMNNRACYGTPISFRDSTQADTTVVKWQWDFGDGGKDTVKNPVHLYTRKGLFDVKLYTYSATGCLDSMVRKGYVAIGDTAAPKPVRIYRVTVVDDRTLEFEFAKYADVDFAAYVIYREVPGGLFFPIDTVFNSGDTVYALNTVDTRHFSYCYKVQAINLCGVRSDLNATQKHCTINLIATTPLKNQVVLDWNKYVGWKAVKRYEVYREDVNNIGVYKLLATVPAGINTYTDTAIVCYKRHTYKIRAVEDALTNAQESWSDTAAAKPIYLGYVGPVEVIRSTVENDRYVRVEWTPSSARRIKYYFIERSDDGITYQPITMPLSPATLLYEDRKVFVDSFYYNYRIKVQDSCGDMSQVSNVGRTMLLFVDTNANGQPSLNWTPYLGWPEGVKYYSIELRNTAGNFNEVFKTADGSITEYTDAITDLNTQKEYCYRVVAHRQSPPTEPGKNDAILSVSNVACAPLRSVLFIPNAFTPNGDDYNNVFFVKGMYLRDYKLQIFNRWGQLVFESKDMEEGWNGTYKGSLCEQGVYVYMISSRGADNKFRYTRGTVTLMP